MLANPLGLIVSWFFLIAVAAYLVVLRKVVSKLKRDHGQYWTQIGSPTLSDPNGQVTLFLKLICGVGLPETVAHACGKRLMILRILLAASMLAFIAIIAMGYSGLFH